MVKVKIENGYYLFKLDDLLKDNDISINKLMRDTNTDFKVLKRLMTGELVRFDIFVVARLCDYFNCDIEERLKSLFYFLYRSKHFTACHISNLYNRVRVWCFYIEKKKQILSLFLSSFYNLILTAKPPIKQMMFVLI